MPFRFISSCLYYIAPGRKTQFRQAEASSGIARQFRNPKGLHRTAVKKQNKGAVNLRGLAAPLFIAWAVLSLPKSAARRSAEARMQAFDAGSKISAKRSPWRPKTRRKLRVYCIVVFIGHIIIYVLRIVIL